MERKVVPLGLLLAMAALFVIIGPSTTTVPVLGQTSEGICTDSDGGLVYDIAGYVTGVGPNGYPFTKFDVCETGDAEGYVREFYCNGTLPWPRAHACPNGCADGACLVDLACTDADGDGYAPDGGACGEVDCDDSDAAVHPGASEVCDNAVDDNCDGLVDVADSACFVCTDADGDGYALEGGACGAVDCDDTDPAVHPGAVEVCDNGVDDDCNGWVDADDAACGPLNVIVVGWDGTQRDHFWECYHRELPECPDGLPNLAALSGGAIFNTVISSGETSTKAGWTQVLTGYRAEVTGVLTNGDYQPIPEGYTLFEKIENHFGPDNVVTMFVSGKDVHTGAACVGEETTDGGMPVIEDQGQPWCLTKDHLDVYDNDLRQNDVVGNRALALLDAHQRDRIFAFFLFRDPDVTGHVAGENSSYYTRQLLDDDRWLGRIMDEVQALGIADHTLIYVTTDHGFDEDGRVHHNARYGFVASNDPAVMRGGDRMDLAPTILEVYGISREALGAAPPVDGQSLHALPPVPCVAEGGAFIDYPGAPVCCAGLTRIGLEIKVGVCLVPTGGTGDDSGYCTACGNGICEAPENPCNCPEDCRYY